MVVPLLVDERFQVLFHSPNRGSFHLSLTVLVHYRSLRRIEPWEMVLPDSHEVSRASWYSGTESRDAARFGYGVITLFDRPFQSRSPTRAFGNSPDLIRTPPHNPRKPGGRRVWAVPRSLAATDGIAIAFFSFGY